MLSSISVIRAEVKVPVMPHEKHPTDQRRTGNTWLHCIFTGFAYTFDYQQTNNLALSRAREKDGVDAQSEECSVPCDHYDIGVSNKG